MTDLERLEARAVMAGPALTHARELQHNLEGTGWKRLERRDDGESWQGRIRGQPLRVIWSTTLEDDGQHWLHVSASHQARVPTWPEMSTIKDLFIGDHRWAAQLHPPRDDYIDLHPNVLHLWSPLETWPLPDFTQGTGSI